ncbi:hypothetical protein BC940DRAFT_298140 [Gongronella butleri]|nr:hypothetical protein BC940DRAFT_298140 [Gongronella butleri]
MHTVCDVCSQFFFLLSMALCSSMSSQICRQNGSPCPKLFYAGCARARITLFLFFPKDSRANGTAARRMVHATEETTTFKRPGCH